MTVKDLLQEGALEAELRRQQQLGQEIKARQRLGSHSAESNRIFSSTPVDFTLPGSSSGEFILTFTPDDLTFNGALCYQLVVMYKVSGDPTYTRLNDPRSIRRLRDDGTGVQKWHIRFVNGATDYSFKFYLFAMGSGTFNAALVL